MAVASSVGADLTVPFEDWIALNMVAVIVPVVIETSSCWLC